MELNTFVAANFTNGSATAVNVTGSGGGVMIGNSTGGLAINNTASTGIGITMKNTAAATSSACSSSAPINIDGTYWTGLASATNVMSLTPSCTTGTNGTETLTIADSGSTGLFTVVHSGEVTATAFGGSGSATLAAGVGSGTSPTIACEASHICSGANGTIDLTTGTSTTTGALLTITAPGTAHTNLPDCEAHIILDASPYTAMNSYQFSYTTSIWTLNVGTALTASTAYQVTYHCMGY